jgi:PHP family Zn ribbon phosphoesterase
MNIKTIKNYNNIEELDKYEEAGCYYCLKVFHVDEILEYIDNSTTALCPHCGIDSVVPGVTNKFFLEKAHDYWFKIDN